MKRLLTFLLFTVITLSSTLYAQIPPNAFNYSAVARDASGQAIATSTIGIQISILQSSTTGTSVYTENHFVNTDEFGLFNLVIGAGAVQSGSMTTIDWAGDNYYLKVGMDATGGTNFLTMGTTQLLSVPYALHSATSDSIIGGVNTFSGDYNDLINIPTIPSNTSDLTNDSGFISNPDDADSDPNNELQNWANLPGIPSDIADGDDVDDADADPNNELQNWANLPGIPSDIADGDNVDDADADPNNEIQTISRSGTTITLSNSGGTYEDSVGIYTAGNGIEINNNIVSVSNECGLAIGDNYQGGIIFYLDPSGCHGLICTSVDQSTSVSFDYGVTVYDGFNGSGLFEGKYNIGYGLASSIPRDLVLNGYDDWYLPSIEELTRMYQNVGPGNTLGLGNVGLFSNNSYWSSTEINTSQAWKFNFTNGESTSEIKTTDLHIRAARDF